MLSIVETAEREEEMKHNKKTQQQTTSTNYNYITSTKVIFYFSLKKTPMFSLFKGKI